MTVDEWHYFPYRGCDAMIRFTEWEKFEHYDHIKVEYAVHRDGDWRFADVTFGLQPRLNKLYAFRDRGAPIREHLSGLIDDLKYSGSKLDPLGAFAKKIATMATLLWSLKPAEEIPSVGE